MQGDDHYSFTAASEVELLDDMGCAASIIFTPFGDVGLRFVG